MLMTHKSSRRVLSIRRRGAAAVELAICLPLFVLVLVGSIETCSFIYLHESLTVASYETARMATKPGAKEKKLIENATRILRCRGIDTATINIEPADLDALPAGETVCVSISVPASGKSMLPSPLFGDREITSSITFVRE
jgi:hypothetical protein